MKAMKLWLAGGLTGLILAACSTNDGTAANTAAGSAPVKVNTVNGQLTTLSGMSLYVFDVDVADSGKSACNGACAENWPPFAASANDVPGRLLTIIVREDGSKQWQRLGRPLYLYKLDEKPGDVKGDKFKNQWHIVRVSLTGGGE